MNLYGRNFPTGMYESKTQEMSLRMRKVRIANNAIMTSRKHEYDKSMRTISKAALIISILVLTIEATIGLNNIFHIF